jgi:hypothetical protein
MASAQLLSPRCMAAAASLDVAALNALCSGGLDELLAAAASAPATRAAAAAGRPAAAAAPQPLPAAAGDEAAAAAAAAAAGEADAARAARARAADEVVRKSWQYRVRAAAGRSREGAAAGAGPFGPADGPCRAPRAPCARRPSPHTLRSHPCLPPPPALPARQATGSVAAAAVLADLGVRRVAHGGPEGMKQAAAGLIKVRPERGGGQGRGQAAWSWPRAAARAPNMPLRCAAPQPSPRPAPRHLSPHPSSPHPTPPHIL